MKRIVAIGLILLLLLAACGPAQTGNPIVPGVNRVQAEATIQMENIIAQATQEAGFSATAVAQSTVQAFMLAQAERDALATSTAQYNAGVATAGAQQATTYAQIAEATGTAVSLQSTMTANVAAATAQAGIVLAESTRQANFHAEQVAEARRADRNNIALLVVLVSAGLSIIALIVALAFRIVVTTRPMQAGDTYIYAPALPFSIGGGNGPSPTILTQRQLPRTTATPLLPAALPSSSSTPVEIGKLLDGHLIYVGPTQTGKSTLARTNARARAEAGQRLIIFDPDLAYGDDWGRNANIFDEYQTNDLVETVMELFEERSDLLKRHGQNRVDRERGITVLIDEAPEVFQSEPRILTIVKLLLRRGMKRRIYLGFMTQSDRIATLNIPGEKDLIDNAQVIYTGAYATRRLRETATMNYPAIIMDSTHGPRPLVLQGDTYHRYSSDTVAPTEVIEAEETITTFSDTGPISEEERRTIIALLRQGHSGRSIQQQVYGYPNGGRAYERVKAVRDEVLPLHNPQRETSNERYYSSPLHVSTD